MEKGLRRLAKQCKDIKYTKGLLLGFLIAGTLSFSNSNVAGQHLKSKILKLQ